MSSNFRSALSVTSKRIVQGRERQVPALPGRELVVIRFPPPRGAQQPRDPQGPPLVVEYFDGRRAA